VVRLVVTSDFVNGSEEGIESVTLRANIAADCLNRRERVTEGDGGSGGNKQRTSPLNDVLPQPAGVAAEDGYLIN
jgi:hypothetical protein